MDLKIHTTAAVNIPMGNVAILLLCIAMRRQFPTLAATGVLIFIVSSIAVMLSILAQFGRPSLLFGLGAGGMERLAGYPANIWLLMAGILILLNVFPSNKTDSLEERRRFRSAVE